MQELAPAAPTNPEIGSVFSQAMSLYQAHVGTLLLLCALGVAFDALLTYVGNLVTFGYGEPVFAVLSVVMQEVLYFGPAVLLWNEVQKRRAGETVATGGDALVSTSTMATVFSGFNSKRAWGVAFQVTMLYMSAFTLLVCIGTLLGGIVLYFIPAGFTVFMKVLRTVVGPIIGVGYLATALAVARPTRSVTDATSGGFRVMFRFPVLAGLVLGLGGFLEQLAGLTIVVGILLDGFLLCYSAALVRQLIDARQLQV